MRGLTHERMARMMYPDLDAAMIQRVNRSIDTPQAWMPAVPQGVGRVPGLSYRGHRKYGHDFVTAGMIGYFEGGPAGVKAAWTHLLTDSMRDQMVKSMGYEGADVIEALFNYGYGLTKKRRRR